MNKNPSPQKDHSKMPLVDISIVSHGHGAMVGRLVGALEEFPEVGKIIVTRNIEDSDGVVEAPRVMIIKNEKPKGFGANHNAAFLHSNSDLFCVINPDVEFFGNPFPDLIGASEISGAAIVAPLVLNSLGHLEDSFRHFPTIRQLTIKLFPFKGNIYSGIPDDILAVDWVAGMFMLFRSTSFEGIRGFDERFFLYYEDADICTRLWKSNAPVIVCTQAKVVHDAQRTSRRKFQYMKWHVSSMVLYFWKHWWRLPWRNQV